MQTRFLSLCWSYLKTAAAGVVIAAALSFGYLVIRFGAPPESFLTYGVLVLLVLLAFLLARGKSHPLLQGLRELFRAWWEGPAVSGKTAH